MGNLKKDKEKLQLPKTTLRRSLIFVLLFSFLPTLFIWLFLGNDYGITAANHQLSVGSSIGIFFGALSVIIFLAVAIKFVHFTEWDQLNFTIPIAGLFLTIFTTSYGAVQGSIIARVGITFAVVLVLIIVTNFLTNFVLTKVSTYEIRQAEIIRLKSKPKADEDFVAYIENIEGTKPKVKKNRNKKKNKS